MISFFSWICLVSPAIAASTFFIVTTLFTKVGTTTAINVVPEDQYTFIKKNPIMHINDKFMVHNGMSSEVNKELLRLTELTTKAACYNLTRDFSSNTSFLNLSTLHKKIPHALTSGSYKFNASKHAKYINNDFVNQADIQFDCLEHLKFKSNYINCFGSVNSDNSTYKFTYLNAFIKNILNSINKTINFEEVSTRLHVRADLFGVDFKTFIDSVLPPFELTTGGAYSTSSKVYTQFNKVENASLTQVDDIYKKIQGGLLNSISPEIYTKRLRFSSLQGMITKSDKYNLASYISDVDLVADVKQSVILGNYLKLYLDNLIKLIAELKIVQTEFDDRIIVSGGNLLIADNITGELKNLQQCNMKAMLNTYYFDYIKECFLLQMEADPMLNNFSWDYVFDVKNIQEITTLLKNIFGCKVSSLSVAESIVKTDVCKDNFSLMDTDYEYILKFPNVINLPKQDGVPIQSIKRLRFVDGRIVLDNYTGFSGAETFKFDFNLEDRLSDLRETINDSLKKIRQNAKIDSKIYEFDLVLPKSTLIYPPETDCFKYWARNTCFFETSEHYNVVRRFFFAGVDASKLNLVEAGNKAFAFDSKQKHFYLLLDFIRSGELLFSKTYMLPGDFPTTRIFLYSGRMNGACYTANRVFLCHHCFTGNIKEMYDILEQDYKCDKNNIFDGVVSLKAYTRNFYKKLADFEYQLLFDSFIEFFRTEMVIFIKK